MVLENLAAPLLAAARPEDYPFFSTVKGESHGGK